MRLHTNIDKIPPALVGHAVQDPPFRAEVLRLASEEHWDELDHYVEGILGGEGVPLSDEARKQLHDLDHGKVTEALAVLSSGSGNPSAE